MPTHYKKPNKLNRTKKRDGARKEAKQAAKMSYVAQGKENPGKKAKRAIYGM